MGTTQEKDLLFTICSSQIARDNALLDRVKDKFEIKSERALGEFLEISTTTLADIRAYGKQVAAGGEVTVKERTLTAAQRLRAFDHVGYGWTRDAVMWLFPDAIREEFVHQDNERIKEAESKKASSARRPKPASST